MASITIWPHLFPTEMAHIKSLLLPFFIPDLSELITCFLGYHESLSFKMSEYSTGIYKYNVYATNHEILSTKQYEFLVRRTVDYRFQWTTHASNIINNNDDGGPKSLLLSGQQNLLMPIGILPIL